MKPRYQEAHIHAPRQHAELVESMLESQGALSVTMTDMNDVPWWEPGVEPPEPDKQILIIGLFPVDADTAPILAALKLLQAAPRAREGDRAGLGPRPMICRKRFSWKRQSGGRSSLSRVRLISIFSRTAGAAAGNLF